MAETYDPWIGRSETAPVDLITPRLIASFGATLGAHMAEIDGAPAGLHWCLAPPTIPEDGLGGEGHAKRGGFLPPIPLPRRMWAGGMVEFVAPLRAGDAVTKTSTITRIDPKNGKSGPLCFVAVEHTYANDAGVAIRERQDIVYRAKATAPDPTPALAPLDPDAHIVTTAHVTSVTLFRYSALTFNGHRIHYDTPYCREVEHYPDLVIHGPLQATLLLNLAASTRSMLPRRFTYRGTAPATGDQRLQLGMVEAQERSDLAVYTAQNVKSMVATAEW